MSATPSGWYPDPVDPGILRWWDGQSWTEHTQARPDASPAESIGGQRPAVRDGKERARVGLFGRKKALESAEEEVARLRGDLERLGVLDLSDLQVERASLHAEVAAVRDELDREREAYEREHARMSAELDALRRVVVETDEVRLLQEVGLYQYHHPLEDSVAYRGELARLRESVKAMTRKDGGAIRATNDWTVNGSAAEGRKMVRDFSKLMLRAYNAEADSLVASMKPYKLGAAKDRLDKVAATIEKLGASMHIRVSSEYHRLRWRELELTADYLEKVAEEKERDREERERLREERKVEQEIERERQRLRKEEQHFRQAIAALETKGDLDGAARLREQLEGVVTEIEAVDFRARTLTAGHVYVISNIGAFGEGVLKIGMTRRLEPLDRVRELGDASVPFRFDVHALYFADDAVRIEREMHRVFHDRRVNRVNHRKEFFRVTAAEARDALAELSGELMTFVEEPEALEYRQGLPPTG